MSRVKTTLRVALLSLAIVLASSSAAPAFGDNEPGSQPAAPGEAESMQAAEAPFTENSYWTTPLADDARVHPLSDQVIDFLAADNDLDGCITLAGFPGNSWGMPVYHASAGDPVYDLVPTGLDLPPEFASLRIPLGAQPADNDDVEMVIYDEAAGYVVQLSKASFDAATEQWSAGGGSVTYLDSNGLDGSVTGADDARNTGTFRGYNGAVVAAEYDDVAAGKIERVLKVGINTANTDHIHPLKGSDGDLSIDAAPPQGARLRIDPALDLDTLGLSPQALVIARALQDYGFIIGDSTGGAIVLKLEDTVTSGQGELWELDRQSLCAIQASHLQVVLTSFVDTQSSVFEADILDLVAADITYGCGSWRFCPGSAITRGQMAAFLTRAFDLPAAPSAGFVDTAGSVFADDIDRLAASGITKGCAADRFCPDAPVTRGQMAAFLTRALGLPAAPSAGFVDTAGSEFADDIDRLAAAGITTGCSVNEFCPSGNVTRGQMAAFIMRSLRYAG